MKKILLTFVLVSFFSCNTDLDDNAIQKLLTGTNVITGDVETINKEDKLYHYLALVSKNSETEVSDVGCIEFIYPFILFQFDDENNQTNQVSVLGNENFAELLNNLEEGHSIGLSYPIAGNLTDGTLVSVNNNEELQKSLETCIEEELENILGMCNGYVSAEKCIWKITWSDPEENPYIDSFFSLQEDGSIVFSVLQTQGIEENYEIEEEPKYEIKVGTWIFYFIGADLHLNINLGPIVEGHEEIVNDNIIKTDWNFDWKINYIDFEKIEIEKTGTKIVNTDSGQIEQAFTEKIILERACEN